MQGFCPARSKFVRRRPQNGVIKYNKTVAHRARFTGMNGENSCSSMNTGERSKQGSARFVSQLFLTREKMRHKATVRSEVARLRSLIIQEYEGAILQPATYKHYIY